MFKIDYRYMFLSKDEYYWNVFISKQIPEASRLQKETHQIVDSQTSLSPLKSHLQHITTEHAFSHSSSCQFNGLTERYHIDTCI